MKTSKGDSNSEYDSESEEEDMEVLSFELKLVPICRRKIQLEEDEQEKHREGN